MKNTNLYICVYLLSISIIPSTILNSFVSILENTNCGLVMNKNSQVISELQECNLIGVYDSNGNSIGFLSEGGGEKDNEDIV